MYETYSDLIEALNNGEMSSDLLNKVINFDFSFEMGSDDQRYCVDLILLDAKNRLTSEYIRIIWDFIIDDYGFGIDVFEYFNDAIFTIAESKKTPSDILDSIANDLIPAAEDEDAEEAALADLMKVLNNNPNFERNL